MKVGRQHTEETKRKISMSKKGQVFSEIHRKNLSLNSSKKIAVVCITTGEEFPSLAKAADEYNICASTLSHHLKGDIKSCGKREGQRLIWKKKAIEV